MRKVRTQPNLKRRIVATLIDYTIFYTVFFLYVYVYGSPNDEGGYTVNGFLALLPFPVWVIYFPVIESFQGQTLGHRLTGLMVVAKSGARVNLGQTFVRRLLDPIDIMFFFGLVSILTIKNSPFHQRVGDMVAGTIVIGNETQWCPECHTELILHVNESRLGRFDCPECGKRTILEDQV